MNIPRQNDDVKPERCLCLDTLGEIILSAEEEVKRNHKCGCFCSWCWDESVDRCTCHYGCMCSDHRKRSIPL